MLLADKDHDSPEGLRDFLVVAPRTNHGWEGAQVAAFVKGLLDAVTDPALEASIDPGRIVVSGVSMGGAGAWRAAPEFPPVGPTSISRVALVEAPIPAPAAQFKFNFRAW